MFLYSEHRSHGASGVSVDFVFQKVNQTVPTVETRVIILSLLHNQAS